MAGYLQSIWQQNVQAVYDANEHQIGYYVDLPTLASGHVMLFTGEVLGDPWNWQIKASPLDFTLSEMVNAGQYLIQKGYSPSWMSSQEQSAMQSGSGAAGVPDAVSQFIQSPLSFMAPGVAPIGNPKLPIDWARLGIYGGIGLVGLFALKRAFD